MTTDKREPLPLSRALIELAARDDRAALAALRRSLNEDGASSAWRYVAPYLPAEPDAWRERAMLLVAGLFALHPNPKPEGLTLGRALREVKEETKSESVEGRFVALLNAHTDDLGEHLRHAVSLCRANEKPLDWDDVMRTVLGWGRDDELNKARQRQARAFWTLNIDTNKDDETP